MRNGFTTETAQVKDFNRMVIYRQLEHRALGNVYVQFTLKGDKRETGYVAYDYDRTAWAKTKKEAIKKLESMGK